MARDRPILIAGAGIGGLALAIALARKGIGCQVLERRSDLTESGAGIQLGPNAVAVLMRLGVAATLEPNVGKPGSLRVFSGRSGRSLAELPLGDWIAARHGSPYWVAHRADLHAALLKTCGSLEAVELQTGFPVADATQTADGVVVVSEDGRRLEGALLAGADGLWSNVRRQLWPDAPLPYSGYTATRAVIPSTQAPARFRETVTGAWLAPSGHVVHYPVRGGSDVAVVAIMREPWPGDGWGLPADREILLAKLAPFAPELRQFAAAAEGWRRWPLYDPPPLPQWSKGRITLLGDAAHPVLPFLAQGGALAIEDAETLAAAIARWPADPVEACRRYEKLRRPRAIRVQRSSRENGRIYRLPLPASLARDAVLRLAPGRRLMARYDWVYGWKQAVF